MISVLFEINLEVDGIKDARYIKEDFHKISNKNSIINNINVTGANKTINNVNSNNDDYDNIHCPYCGSSKVML